MISINFSLFIYLFIIIITIKIIKKIFLNDFYNFILLENEKNKKDENVLKLLILNNDKNLSNFKKELDSSNLELKKSLELILTDLNYLKYNSNYNKFNLKKNSKINNENLYIKNEINIGKMLAILSCKKYY